MDLSSILQQTGAIDSISRELGIDSGTAQAGAAALLPAILGGFKSNAQTQPGGLGSLIGMLGGLGGGGLLDSVVGAQPTPVDQGNSILGHIFGSKDVSRQVAGYASNQTGIDAGILKKMLPILAMAVAGYMFHQHQSGRGEQGGGLGGALAGVLGGGGLGGLLSSVLGGGQAQAPSTSGGLGSLLDMDGDGNPLDDILGMAGKVMGR